MMRGPVLGFLLLLVAGQALAQATVGQVHRYSPAFDKLLDPSTPIERLTDDQFMWSEGPLWIPGDNYLLFTDVPGNTVWKWSEQDGLQEWLKPSAYPVDKPADTGKGMNGLWLESDGKIVAGDPGSRSVLRVDLASKEQQQLVTHFQGKRFNSPNDVVMSHQRWPGLLFFTDPPYGLKEMDESVHKELDYNGVYRLETNGEVSLVSRQLSKPNGVGLTPDESTLVVANSDPQRAVWWAWDLDEQGKPVGMGRKFASAQQQADEGQPGLPDGFAFDRHGNLFATGPGGVLIYSPEGELLGLIETGSAIANCAFGGPDGSVLYLTSHRFLARIQTRTQGYTFTSN